MRTPVVLVTMPWALLELPSIALGILSSVLRDAGFSPVVRSFNLTFLELLNRDVPAGVAPVSLQDYREIADASSTSGLGDWLFSVPPFRELCPEEDARYLERLARESVLPERLLARARWIRERVPAFIDACVEELLRHEPAMVGFTTTFNQNVPSLLLARRLKERAPHIQIVFGGANCDGPMGQALHEAFPWVDIVVQGEGEGVINSLVADIVAGRRVAARPGVLVRGEARVEGERPRVGMDEVPVPDYGFYFEELERVGFRDELIPQVKLLVETARGCWWGQKQHCTFCGLNGSSMAFRSKSVERALRDFEQLAGRHRWLDFMAVDNIIDLAYLRELLPRLRERGMDLRIFYETKANLTREQVRDMRAAGIHRIQPGIESLSTPILKLMRKGISAWQNVRLLKYCAQYDMRVSWNILYGFPREPVEEYARMTAAIPALTHLEPPHLSRLHVQRFSPYHQTPEALGLRVDGPLFHYAHSYPVRRPLLDGLAYDFEYTHLDGRNPEDYVGGLREAVQRWGRVHERDRGRLTWRQGPGFVRITDERESFGYASYLLEGEQAEAYRACEAGAGAAQVHQGLREAGHTSIGLPEVEDFLRELVEAGLMFEADGRFVSLALQARPLAGVAGG
jgi:ribosomal peptide maturation radical SAM protein 1